MIRLFNKTTADAASLSYESDGEGHIVHQFVKQYTVSADIAINGTKAIPLSIPKGSKVLGFTTYLKTATGANVAGGHTYVLDHNTNTLTVTALGAAINVNSVLTITYWLGV